MIHSVGVLAYGSLIDDPGPELSKVIITATQAETPFGIEYCRKSGTRGNAPTLTVVSNGGVRVNAQILILDASVDLQSAKDMLYRRERRIDDITVNYSEPRQTSRRMRISVLTDFENIKSVIYVDLYSNIENPTPETLATLAIASALTEAGGKNTDGINYLKNNIDNGIITPLTRQYEQEILRQSDTTSLQAAIDLCSAKRSAY